MSLRVGVAAFGLLLSSSVFSAVTITAPEEIVILAVNGQEVNNGLIPSSKNNYQIDPGNLTLNVRYREYFEHLNGEHDIVKSGVVTIQASDLQDNQSYTLGLVNAPKNFDAAKKYAEQPTVAIYDQNKKLIVQQTGANNEAQPWFSGNSLLGRTLDLTQKNKNNVVNQPAPVYAATTTSATVAAPIAITTTTGTAKTTDQQLAELWQKASKAERQKFMAWLAGQTN
ncbi:YccT family protein [Acinetobacter sp.]|uniref:YccT family protein n=1 Tax=Acinetobacter sp. TaxID=472 RepID=UPI002FDB6C7D